MLLFTKRSTGTASRTFGKGLAYSFIFFHRRNRKQCETLLRLRFSFSGMNSVPRKMKTRARGGMSMENLYGSDGRA